MEEPQTKLTDDETAKLNAALESYRNAPVMNFRVGDPTMADHAFRDMTDLANSIVEAHGFSCLKYGVNTQTWEIVPY